MAKGTTGLPEGFTINVNAQDLNRPMELPGYLDEDPVLALANARRAAATKNTPEISAQQAPDAKVVGQGTQIPVAPMASVASIPKVVTETLEAKASPPDSQPRAEVLHSRRRLQINLSPDGERMVDELLDMLSAQSSERSIKISELIQALVIIAYEARTEINVSRLPIRGRWGSPTANSFPAALSQSLKEAILQLGESQGANPFKKAVGG